MTGLCWQHAAMGDRVTLVQGAKATTKQAKGNASAGDAHAADRSDTVNEDPSQLLQMVEGLLVSVPTIQVVGDIPTNIVH